MSTSTLSDRISSPLECFSSVDVRHQLFDVRALASALFYVLDDDIDKEKQADACRLARMILDVNDGAIERINKVEEVVLNKGD